MLLGTRNLTTGDTRRCVTDYNGFLGRGVKLKSPAATNGTAGTTSTVQNVSLDPTETYLIFFVTGGTLNEVFTVNVVVSTTDGQTINDTISFTVVAP